MSWQTTQLLYYVKSGHFVSHALGLKFFWSVWTDDNFSYAFNTENMERSATRTGGITFEALNLISGLIYL